MLQNFRAHITDVAEGVLGLGIFTLGWWYKAFVVAEGIAQAITIFIGAAIAIHSGWRVFVRPWINRRRDAMAQRRRAGDRR